MQVNTKNNFLTIEVIQTTTQLLQFKQGVAQTGRNTTGPPCYVAVEL